VFIDEAGQVSLANALAIATAARFVYLMGDPLQLAQVSQAQHPGTSGASVLEHSSVPTRRFRTIADCFLAHTYRMHPDVCRFVSEVVYEGRLESAPECARQRIDPFGTGLRFIAIEHEGNSQSSPEEANRIADEIERVLRSQVTAADGSTRPLEQRDIMVVAPYNAQVRCVNEVLKSAD